jgi:nanoRNase/pAp phosphatase (c-di-AMP/oligoRNAs hydrolase)
MLKKDSKDPGKTNFSFYRNNFKVNAKKPDLLKIAQALNPELSGGHVYACGATMPADMTVEQAIEKISELLKHAEDTV